MNKFKKGIMVSVLSLTLVIGLASISLAMEGMDTGELTSKPSNAQHEATPGMDSDMPGMESNTLSSDGHTENEASEGVDWTVAGGFLAINLLVIGTAGVLKFTQKPKLEIVD